MQDQVDIYEFINTLIKRKKLVFFVIIVFTLSAISYISMAKPIYGGNAMMEIGQIVNNDPNTPFFKSFDEAKDLKIILNKMTQVGIRIPRDTQLLELKASGNSKKNVQDKLEYSIDFILNRHKKMAKIYSGKHTKVRMSQLVGTIKIYEAPIKPNKKLILSASLITSLLFSIFLIFFLEYLAELKRERASKPKDNKINT